MALDLSNNAKLSIEQVAIDQNIIFKIDGIDEIFGAGDIYKSVRIGDPEAIIGEFYIGGVINAENSRPWLSREGSLNNIGQQIEPDKGSASSVTAFQVRLIDKNNLLSKIFSPGDRVADIVGRRAEVWASANNAAYPDDSVRIFVGILSGLTFGASYVDLVISHPDQLRRQKIFPKYNSKLNGAINNSVTTIPVDTVGNFISPLDALESYIKIGDEFIKVGGISGSSFTLCTRGQFGTIAEAHDDDDEVESFYTLTGDPIDLALKLMLSNGGTAYKTGVAASKFEQVTPLLNVDNAIFLASDDPYFDYGLVAGDTITTTGATNGANNVTDKVITDIVLLDDGSYLVVDGVTFVTETGSAALASFKSKYNTLPIDAGLNIKPEFVDVENFASISALLGAIPDVLLPISEEIDGKEYIEKQIYFPFGIYSIPRKSRISINALLPPLATNETPILDVSNIVNPQNIKVSRDINKYFYNATVYKFGKDFVEDKFFAGEIIQSASSTTRIEVGNRPYEVESDGMLDNTDTRTYIQAVAQKILSRYQFGAEVFNIEVLYRDGLTIDIGDTVILDGVGAGITDTLNGTKQFKSRVLETVNKSYNLFDGKIEIIAVDTSYDLGLRYGVVGPSSKANSGCTTTVLRLKRSFDDTGLGKEIDKWIKYVGLNVVVHNEDWSNQETVEILRISPTIPNAIEVTPALSFTPAEDDIIDMAGYGDAGDIYKAIHVFNGARVLVTASVSSTVFTVGAGDTSKFFVGGLVRVHTTDYSSDSGSVEVVDITGNNITVESMGYTPLVGHEVDLIGFSSDEGAPYVYY